MLEHNFNFEDNLCGKLTIITNNKSPYWYYKGTIILQSGTSFVIKLEEINERKTFDSTEIKIIS